MGDKFKLKVNKKGIIYIMPQRYKKPSESFGFLEKLYVLYIR